MLCCYKQVNLSCLQLYTALASISSWASLWLQSMLSVLQSGKQLSTVCNVCNQSLNPTTKPNFTFNVNIWGGMSSSRPELVYVKQVLPCFMNEVKHRLKLLQWALTSVFISIILTCFCCFQFDIMYLSFERILQTFLSTYSKNMIIGYFIREDITSSVGSLLTPTALRALTWHCSWDSSH